MSVRYSRTGGWRPPRDREMLEIDNNGDFTMWRSVAWATPIGRFAGHLDQATFEVMQGEVAAAAHTGDLKILPVPDAAVDTITLDGIGASMASNNEPEGPWGVLVKHLRTLLRDLTLYPRAAIALEVQPGGAGARLVHRGNEPLRLDLSSLSVQVMLWEDDVPIGDWRATQLPPGASADVTAGPRWSLDLPFDHGFHVTQGTELGTYVTFDAYDENRRIPVKLTLQPAGKS